MPGGNIGHADPHNHKHITPSALTPNPEDTLTLMFTEFVQGQCYKAGNKVSNFKIIYFLGLFVLVIRQYTDTENAYFWALNQQHKLSNKCSDCLLACITLQETVAKSQQLRQTDLI